MKLWSYEQKEQGLYSIRDEESNERIAFDLSKEQAEEIARAVNSLPELVKVVQKLRSQYVVPVGFQYTMLEEIDSALKLAKGE